VARVAESTGERTHGGTPPGVEDAERRRATLEDAFELGEHLRGAWEATRDLGRLRLLRLRATLERLGLLAVALLLFGVAAISVAAAAAVHLVIGAAALAGRWLGDSGWGALGAGGGILLLMGLALLAVAAVRSRSRARHARSVLHRDAVAEPAAERAPAETASALGRARGDALHREAGP